MVTSRSRALSLWDPSGEGVQGGEGYLRQLGEPRGAFEGLKLPTLLAPPSVKDSIIFKGALWGTQWKGASYQLLGLKGPLVYPYLGPNTEL